MLATGAGTNHPYRVQPGPALRRVDAALCAVDRYLRPKAVQRGSDLRGLRP
jgi:hypothetical protein